MKRFTLLSASARYATFFSVVLFSAGLATAQFADDTGTGSTTLTDAIAINLAANTAPSAGQATIGGVGVTGFGVPSGPITLTNVTVTLQPAPGSSGPIANIPPIS